MFFHHDGLAYFIHEVKPLLDLFKEHRWTEGGKYNAVSTSIKKGESDKFVKFQHQVLPRLKQHIIDINNHIASEDHFLKSIHKTLLYEVIVKKMERYEKTTTEEKELHEYLGKLYRLHSELLPIVEKLEKELQTIGKSPSLHELQEELIKLSEKLEQIHHISIKTAKAMKQILREFDKAHELLERDIDDFKRNMKSWIHIVEE